MLTLADQLSHVLPMALAGRVTRIVGLTAAVGGFPAPLGATVRFEREHGEPVEGE